VILSSAESSLFLIFSSEFFSSVIMFFSFMILAWHFFVSSIYSLKVSFSSCIVLLTLVGIFRTVILSLLLCKMWEKPALVSIISCLSRIWEPFDLFLDLLERKFVNCCIVGIFVRERRIQDVQFFPFCWCLSIIHFWQRKCYYNLSLSPLHSWVGFLLSRSIKRFYLFIFITFFQFFW
jgi:hypothetical protein